MLGLGRVIAAIERGIAAARRRSRRFDHAWRAADRYGEVLAGRLAAAIAYYGFFAVFALALLAYAVLGFVLQRNLAVYAAVGAFLEVNLPWLEPQSIEASSGQVAFIGIAGLVVTGVGWIEAIRSSQRLVHGVEQQPGNIAVRWLVDLGLLVALFLLLAVSLATVYALEWLVEELTGGPSVLLATIGWIFSVLVNIVLAAALLGGVPRLRLPMRALVPVVLLVGGGITVLNTAGQWVIERVRDNPAYTVMTSAVAVLLYLYLFNQMLLFGAALIATSGSGRRTRGETADFVRPSG
ncbi:MAG TPA: YhjD/YihY/BrkB family envelope integrity protein [Pilimelia sp.]|nr:YhjD/YihY/BrkB family envelope integrity protein [Pilimelia sp.]